MSTGLTREEGDHTHSEELLDGARAVAAAANVAVAASASAHGHASESTHARASELGAVVVAFRGCAHAFAKEQEREEANAALDASEREELGACG